MSVEIHIQNAVKRYGEKGRNGVVEIRARR